MPLHERRAHIQALRAGRKATERYNQLRTENPSTDAIEILSSELITDKSIHQGTRLGIIRGLIRREQSNPNPSDTSTRLMRIFLAVNNRELDLYNKRRQRARHCRRNTGATGR